MTSEPENDLGYNVSAPDQTLSINLLESDISEARQQAEEAATQDIAASLSEVPFGYVNFDSGRVDSTTSGLMVPPDQRRGFRRESYVGVKDSEQEVEFLGRIVEGPFHTPHEVSPDSALTRTTVLHPDRAKFRPTYYVYGTIEILGRSGKTRESYRHQPDPDHMQVHTSSPPIVYRRCLVLPAAF